MRDLVKNEKDVWVWQEPHESFPLKLSLFWPVHALCYFNCPCAMAHLTENWCSWFCCLGGVHDNLAIFAQSLSAFLSPASPETFPANMPFPVPLCSHLCCAFACPSHTSVSLPSERVPFFLLAALA